MTEIKRTPLREPESAFPDTPVMTPLEAFAAVDEPGAEALVGTRDSNLIPVGGDAMLYGDGGAGKTTLAIDLGFHLATGRNWLGLEIEKPATVLLIENEGPRPLFRRKLRRKLSAWGEVGELADRLWIWEEPWRGFTFGESDMRAHLAMLVYDLGVDLVVAGPVTALGMEDAGTMRDVRQFAGLLADVRERSGRPVAFLLVHHENKGGRVSGAWEGVGDTMLHLQRKGGEGAARLYVQKARWNPEMHRKALGLAWSPGDTYELVAADARLEERAERVWDEIETYVRDNAGASWNAIKKAVAGDETYKRRRRDAMVEEGIIVDLGTGSRSAYWHRDDPALPLSMGSGEESGEKELPTRPGSGEQVESNPPPRNRGGALPTSLPTRHSPAEEGGGSGWGGRGAIRDSSPPTPASPAVPEFHPSASGEDQTGEDPPEEEW